jgi:hypothetical protein
LRREGYTWPVDPTIARVTGRGDFRGHDVIWVQRLARAVGGMREPPVALDARTHRPVGTRFVADGKVFDAQVYRFLGTVPAVVPDDGVLRSYLSSLSSFPYGFFGPRVSPGGSERASLREARDVLGRNLFWLGPSFQGHPLTITYGDPQLRRADGWDLRRAPRPAGATPPAGP